MNSREYDEAIQRNYPAIAWGEPIGIRLASGGPFYFACRLCVARTGLKRSEVPRLPVDAAEVRRHIKETHAIRK